MSTYGKMTVHLDEGKDMTDQLRQTLELNYRLAKESGDQQRINDAREAIDQASMECQAHTADRVKRIESKCEKMDVTLDSINTQITDVATSRAKLTEQYNETTVSLNLLKEKFEMFLAANGKQDGKTTRWWDFLTTESFRFFVLTLLLIWAFIYLNTGRDGVEAVKSGALATLNGGRK